ncbi:MAG: alpha/beta hydrolase [Asgard group archaeon]|nr:alpha/beta hydrolase [Asgard group archaeon]
MTIEEMFILPQETLDIIDNFIEENRQKAKYFHEERESEVLFVPIEDGELRVFHHKPKNQTTKRPIVFFPGFGNPPLVWQDFGLPIHNKGEYYVIETREKKSSKLKKSRKIKFSIDQMAKDVGEVLKYLKLEGTDYILMSASFCGGVLLQGLVKKYYNPGTVVALDPFPKFIHHKFIVRIFFGLTPGFVLDVIKVIQAKIVLLTMKNKAQKERNIATVKAGVGWKWRRALLHNLNFDIYPNLREITNEVYLFHGPKDRYHPREIYYNITKAIPKGRFFFMDAKEEKRELLAGAIVKEFAFITQIEKLPEFFKQFEIKIDK